MKPNHWLVKSEPEDYSWENFLKDGGARWTGIRNFQARNNLRAMKRGDTVLFYHSGSEKQVVGIAQVVREAYRDPTATEGEWYSVDLAPDRPLAAPVTLAAIKSDKRLADILLVRNSRLSVMPLTAIQFARILELGE